MGRIDTCADVAFSDLGVIHPGDSETIVSILKRNAQTFPAHKSHTWIDQNLNETQHLTNGSLWEQAGRIASMLKHYGVQKGDRVMIAYPFGLDFLTGLFGCMRAGAIACSVYPPHPSKASDFEVFHKQVNDAGAKFALTTTSYKRVIMLRRALSRKAVTWLSTDGITYEAPTEDEDFLPAQDDPAFIQYTSGSTSSPKGVVLSHRCVVYNTYRTYAVAAHPHKNPEGVIAVCWAPQYHDMGLISVFLAAVHSGKGQAIAFSPLDFIKNPILWHDAIIKYRATTTVAPNFSFGLLLKRLAARSKAPEQWTSMTSICCGGEPVDPLTLGRVTTVLGVPASNIRITYGMAECGVFAGYAPLMTKNDLVACIHLDGISTVRVVENTNTTGRPRQVVSDGTVGEIWVQAPEVTADGYWGKEQLSKETFSNTLDGYKGKWLATGDLGVASDGFVFVTGRAKEVIIINGRNIFPTDIERTVQKAFPVIRPGCIVAFQHGDTGAGLVAEVREGTKPHELPNSMEICRVVSSSNQVDLTSIRLLKCRSVPKTTSGKLKRVAVKERSRQGLWKEQDILSQWALGEQYPKTEGKWPSEPKEDCIPNFILGARYGTQCPHAKAGLGAFYGARSDDQVHRYSDGVVEDATTSYSGVCSELKSFQRRLQEGSVHRPGDHGAARATNQRFYDSVPGVCPHRSFVGQESAKHDTNRPWLKERISANALSQTDLRSSAAEFFSCHVDGFSMASIAKWTVSVVSSVLLPKTMKVDSDELAALLVKVSDMAFCPQPRETDEPILAQKANLISEITKHCDGMTQEQASLLLDLLLAPTGGVTNLIRCALAILTSASTSFELHDFELCETNVRQFVWECIRLFPPVEVVPWWEGANKRHACVIAMAGRDQQVWGKDADLFNPSRASAEEYDQKSCFFAEQSSGYSCLGKQLVLEMTSAFLLEFVSSGSWKCKQQSVRFVDVAPYFGDLDIVKLPSAIVIGAGAAGLTCALTLAKQGVNVTVLERNDAIGGHARHAQVFGHERNPAFGLFFEEEYPNVVALAKELGVEQVPVGPGSEGRCMFSEDGTDIPSVQQMDVARFISDMNRICAEPASDSQLLTLGDYLKSNGYDDEFAVRFFVGKIVHFFAGLTIQEYLDLPLVLAAWVVKAHLLKEKRLWRFRNREYMEAFRSKLLGLGVDIRCGCKPTVLQRDEGKVQVATGVDGEVVEGDYLVLAVPPAAASSLLKERILGPERILNLFDCRAETVVMHTDPAWVMENSKSILHGRLPTGSAIPPPTDTIPLTTRLPSDTDGQTDIYVTHSYANYKSLSIKGPKEHKTFTHVRITPETLQLRKLLASVQGSNRTYYTGGWTRGFMLHEDAVASGIETANSILKKYDLEQREVLSREVELPSCVVNNHEDSIDSTPDIRMSVDKLRQTVLESFRATLGLPLDGQMVISDLGLSSLKTAALYASLSEKLALDSDAFPVGWLFEEDLTIEGLTSRLEGAGQFAKDETSDSGAVEGRATPPQKSSGAAAAFGHLLPQRDVEDDIFVCLRRGAASRQAIVCVYDGLGMGYGRQLLQYLPSDNPFYMTQAPEWSNVIGGFNCWRERVEHHSAAIVRKFSNSGVHLIGYSYGGLLAYCMAKELKKANVQLSLTMLDPQPVRPVAPASLLKRRAIAVDTAVQGLGHQAFVAAKVSGGAIQTHEQLDNEIMVLSQGNEQDCETLRRVSFLFATLQNSCSAMDRVRYGLDRYWSKSRYSGVDATVFVLSQGADFFGDLIPNGFNDDGMYGWSKPLRSARKVTVHGKHTDFFAHDENVEALAEHLLFSCEVSRGHHDTEDESQVKNLKRLSHTMTGQSSGTNLRLGLVFPVLVAALAFAARFVQL